MSQMQVQGKTIRRRMRLPDTLCAKTTRPKRRFSRQICIFYGITAKVILAQFMLKVKHDVQALN